MTAKTTAERQQEFKQRREAAGLKELRNIWCHPDDAERIKAYVARLNAARDRSANRRQL